VIRNRSTKRARRSQYIESSDEEGVPQAPLDIRDEKAFPSLPSPSAGKREREKKTAVSTVPAIAPTPTAVPFLKGPALKGEPRLIDPYPLGLARE